jgi:dipeptidase D
MENITKDLMPQKVFYFFEEISKIPRGSKKEKKISDWLVKFAKDRNLEVYQDSVLNVVIKKPGSNGHENYSPLILQGHMDMVWEKNSSTDFDFETEGIKLAVKDGFLKAVGTTLGADNGIAVAIILAILDSKEIVHPPLEAVITADEEAGMTGVENLDVSLLEGKTMLNIDTEEEGEIYVSSAGGSRVQIDFNFQRDSVDEGTQNILLEIKGLNGGHSGSDIDKGLGNSIKILSFILSELSKKFSFKLYDVNGGDKTNAIPREAFSLLNIAASDFENFIKESKVLFEDMKSTYSKTEQSLTMEIKDNVKTERNPISLEDSRNLINLLCEVPNGVITNSAHIDNLVETSLSMGVLRTHDNTSSIQLLLRSSVNSALHDLENKLRDISKLYNADFTVDSSYSSWEYKEDSKIRELFTEAHKDIFQKTPKIKAIHAGLECGIFAGKINGLDVTSIGPNIYGAHTPEERMEISSVEYTWNWILKALELYKI